MICGYLGRLFFLNSKNRSPFLIAKYPKGVLANRLSNLQNLMLMKPFALPWVLPLKIVFKYLRDKK